jgi:hypothetical protein
VRLLLLTCKRPSPLLLSHSVRSAASQGQPSRSRWFLGIRRLAQRCCSTRRWSAAGRNTSRLSPIASRGMLEPARQKAVRLSHLAHSRHLLAEDDDRPF